MPVKKIVVTLPYITEEIYIGDKLADFILTKLKSRQYDKFFLIIDNNVRQKYRQYFDKLAANLNVVDIIGLKPTPSYKSFNTCEKIIRRLIKGGASRNTCLISAGGGYISDITGYIASNYMRGLDFVQIGTTFMSMVDSVIGKVAINFGGSKNLLGDFYSPRYVFSDLAFLSSLQPEEKILGLVEVWKHALIKQDDDMISKIEKYLVNFSNRNFPEFIEFSIKVKKTCVTPDYNDRTGQHKILSLGHTFANFLEKDSKFRHGAAVMYGIIFEAILSKNLKTISNSNYRRIIRTAKKFETNIGLLKKVQRLLDIRLVLKSFLADKISDHNKFSFVLLTEQGPYFKKGIDPEIVALSLAEFKKLKLT